MSLLRILVGVVVLSAVTGAAAVAQTVEEKVFFRRVLELLSGEDIGLAELLLRDRLAERPGDPSTEFGLALVHIQRNRRDEAEAIHTRLAGIPSAQALAAQLRRQLDEAMRLVQTRREVESRLRAFDGDGAIALVRSLGTDTDRAELLSQIDLYRGRFAGATAALLPLRASPAGQKQFNERLELARAASQLFKQRVDRINWYLTSPLGSTSCTPDQAVAAASSANFTLQEYVTTVSESFIEHPLNDWLMDVAFHAALVSSSYEQVESFGDLVLRAKGKLKVPFFDRMQRFWLVIDARQRRLYTEPDANRSKNDYGSEDLQVALPFSVSFDDIRRIQQASNSDLAGRFMRRDAYALKLEPNARLAPYYLFMPLIHCLYGEAAQKTVTRTLGRYVQHAIGRNTPVELVDPAVATKDWLGTFTNITAWGGAAAEMTLTISLSPRGERKDNIAPDVAIDRALSLQQGLVAEKSRVNSIVDAQRDSHDLFFDTANQQLAKLFDRIGAQSLFTQISTLAADAAQ